MYFSGPFVFPAFQKWPQYRQLSYMIGLPIVVAALLASSFATKVSHLILTQGVLYAIGGIFLYSPAILFLDEWFVRRKGLAYGVMWVSSSYTFAGVAFDRLTYPSGRYRRIRCRDTANYVRWA